MRSNPARLAPSLGLSPRGADVISADLIDRFGAGIVYSGVAVIGIGASFGVLR